MNNILLLPPPTQGPSDPVPPAPHDTTGESVLSLVLTEAAGRLECLAQHAEADAERLNALREPSAAASCHLEAHAFRLAAQYLHEHREGWPDRLTTPIRPGNCVAHRKPTPAARWVASFKAACDVLLEHATALGAQGADAAGFHAVIAGGYRAEAAALRFAASALATVTSASRVSLVA